jgi:hypothetical protein
MADAAVTRALKRSAKTRAKRVPRRASADTTPSEHVLKAREEFAYFCTAMGKPPAPHMLEWHRQWVTGESNEHLMDVAGPDTCLLSPRGPLDLKTPVLTPTGWRPLKKIREGELVYASNGRPTRVEEVMRYGKAPCWEVSFSDGLKLVCDDTHRFLVRRAGREGADWHECTLNELRTCSRLRPRREISSREGPPPWIAGRCTPRWAVPLCKPVELPVVQLPIDPYVMGVLLVRGGLSGNAVRFTSRDPDLVARVGQEAPEGCVVRRIAASRAICWSICGDLGPREDGPRRACRNPILPLLEIFGLWGERIGGRPMPAPYLKGSIPQRLALLQGMLDAAGNSRKGGIVSVPVRSTAVADGLAAVARSLGGVARVRPITRRSGGETNVVEVTLPARLEPFHSTIKAATYRLHCQGRRTSVLQRTIVDIRPVGQREIGCIAVDSPLRDFITQDYVVSCNSAKSTELGLLCAWLIGRHTMAKRLLRILYVSFNIDVARAKSLAIKNTLQSAEYQEIFPCVRISKNRSADELWSIDFDYAGVDIRGEDAFTLACAGLRGTIVSKRANLVVLDDLIKSQQSISNPEVRREMRSNWSNVIVPTMFQGARAIALGTRFHFDDIFATTFTEAKGWHVIIQEALVYEDDGTVRSYWEEMWSLVYLLGLKEKDPISFAYQYLNKAVQASELGISPELFIRSQIPDTFDEIGVSIDFSSGLKERNDFTVFMLGGRLGSKGHVIDYRRMRSMGNVEKIEALCDMLHEWNLLERDGSGLYLPTMSEVSVWPESVGYQKSFEGDFKRIALEEWGLENLYVRPISNVRGDKLARFRGVMGLLQTGRITFNKYRDFQVVFDEVINLGHAAHDDCADGLQILLERLFHRGVAEIEY